MKEKCKGCDGKALFRHKLITRDDAARAFKIPKAKVVRNYFAWTYRTLHQFNSKFERDLWMYQNQNRFAWIRKAPAKEAREYLRTRRDGLFKVVQH